MKTNELMIGDWVAFNDTYRMIAGIHEYPDTVMLDTYFPSLGYRKSTLSFGIEYAKPIPLTAEILEKNAFNKDSLGFYWIDIEKQMAGDGIESQKIDVYCGKVLLIHTAVCEIQMPIKFVHELQHALRLCGIEKEIIL